MTSDDLGLQGDAVLLEEGVSLKSGDCNHEPLIGFVDLRALGESLMSADEH